MQRIGFGLQVLSALLAFAAGALWWQSTRVKTPESVTWLGVIGEGLGRPLGQPLGGGQTVSVVSDGFDDMVAALNAQSRWNRWAAYAATAAAVVQGVADLVPAG